MTGGNVFNGGMPISGFELVTFTEAKTPVMGVRAEYYQYENGVKFHFWGDPEFPETFETSLMEAFAAFPKENIIVEYVPEVDSWYGEVKNVNTLTSSLIERIVSKIATAVENNGKE